MLLPFLNLDLSSKYTAKTITNHKIINKHLNIKNLNNTLFNNVCAAILEANTKPINPYFLIGLIEGDGSFYVGLRANGKIRFGFNIVTSIDDLLLLYKIQHFLCCGKVESKTTWCRLVVEGNKDLRNIVMLVVKSGPFGDKLIGSKSQNYEIFQKVMILFQNKNHMKKEGLRQIAELVYSSSNLKNRKLTLEEYLKTHNLL